MTPTPPEERAQEDGSAKADPALLRHEQRNLLNQIIGYSELLIEEARDWEHQGLAADLEKIRGAGQRLLGLGPMVPAQRSSAETNDDALALPALSSAAPGRILVVDDDPDNRELLLRRLQHEGHQVSTAESGAAALALLAAQEMDLVLLDLLMPEMDGEVVLRTLKQDPALRHLPVLMLSAVGDLDSVVRCIELGAEDYLPKPFSPVLLRARIGASLEKKRRAEREVRAVVPPPAPPALVSAARVAPEDSRVRVDLDPAVLLKVGGALLAIWLVHRAWSVVILVIITLMFVATLGPLVRRLEARIHRGYGIGLVAVGVVSMAAGLLAILVPPVVRQGQSLITQFPIYAQTIEGALRRWRVPLSLATLTQGIRADAAPQLLTVASVVLGGVIELLMVAVLTIYLLIDGPKVQMSLIRLFPRQERLAVRQLLATAAERVGTFMRGQLLMSLLVGVFSFAVLLFCRVPEPIALAVWMAVADCIPMVGVLVGTAPAALLALTQSPSAAAIVTVSFLLYHQFESTVLVPRLYSGTMKLSGSVIVLSLLVGGKLMGAVGALIALPVAAVLPVVVRYVGQWRDRQVDRQRQQRSTP